MKKKSKKRIITILLILIAVIALAVAFYVIQRTEEAYQFQKAYEHWLDLMYGKMLFPPKSLLVFWAQRGAGIAVAVICLVAALCLNIVKPKKRICPQCSAPFQPGDRFCPKCGAPLK